METKLTQWYAMTSHVIAYRSTDLLFGTHTFNFNCFFEDFNCVFTQIRCLSRLLISYLELWGPSCSTERNQLGKIGRRHSGEHSIEIAPILNLDQWLRRRCHLKKKFTDDAQRPITIAHLKPSSPAKVSSYLPFDKPFASRPSKFIISAN